MTPANLKTLIFALLAVTSLMHLGVAFWGAPADLKAPLAAFGVAYGVLAFVVRSGGRAAVIGAMGICGVGLALGGAKYLQAGGGPITMPIMLAIDVAIIAAGALWLMKSGKAG
jgi:hypothetical protein